MHKTLPAALRGRGSCPGEPDQVKSKRNSGSASISEPSPLFGGLNLNLGLSNLISGGINFLGHFRRKTPTSSSASTPVHPPLGRLPSSTVTSSTSAVPLTRSKSGHSSTSSRSSSYGSSSDVYYEAFEHIELCSFPTLPEAAGDDQTGEGHNFGQVGSYNPIWCDLCGDLIWGLYDTGASRCDHCDFTCHVKCQRRVRLNCSSLNKKSIDEKFEDINEDDETLADISTLKDEVHSRDHEDQINEDDMMTLKGVKPIQMDDLALQNDLSLDSGAVFGPDLQNVINIYNSIGPSGQDTIWDPETKICRGFIRVQLNLRRPINVISGTRPPSVYNITKDDTVTDRTLTSFYLPADTEKSLHVTSDTTTKDVIKSLLAKFRVADTPHKYALYDKTLRSSVKDDDKDVGSTLSRVKMRKMKEDEKPLILALKWCKDDVCSEKCFVLQENDPGEVSWDSFSIPELKNFLKILDREEAWYKKRIHDKYEMARSLMQNLVKEKRPVAHDLPEDQNKSSKI